MNIRFFLPFLFALPAMAQTPEEIVFTVSEIPHRLVVENANHQQKRLLLALNPKATAFFDFNFFDGKILFNSNYGFFGLFVFNFLFIWYCLTYLKYQADFNSIKNQIVSFFP